MPGLCGADVADGVHGELSTGCGVGKYELLWPWELAEGCDPPLEEGVT